MPAPLQVSAVRSRIARLLFATTVVYMLVLVCATHYPKPEQLLPPDAPSDKTLHLLAYGLLALLAGAATATAGRWVPGTVGSLVAGLVAFAALDEVTQPLFPPRTADLLDWAADFVGIAVGLGGIAIGVAIVSRLRPASAQRQLGVGTR